MVALLLSSSFFLPGSSVHPETERLIQDICQRVDNFQFCNTTMNANLRAYDEGIEDLAHLAILVALDSATRTKGYAEELTRQATDKDLKFCLKICSNSYAAVNDSFTAAKKQFDGRDFDAVDESEKKAAQPIKDCDFMFLRTSTRENPLLERNRQMSDLTQIALSALQNLLP
ncbi:hypothetical protein PVL29_017873 [Vitis rotundifolia]|uniref:Pectinesterase inhibitor domain-containing protein n=1 Tax=Vitis rotundifolia TaxID=103349 RepID=A0AA39DGV0_VITRO|nr:hypothetical protein PVL29_017873 [Vitis rotundifolia]